MSSVEASVRKPSLPPISRATMPLDEYRLNLAQSVVATVAELIAQQQLDPRIGRDLVGLASLDPYGKTPDVEMDELTAQSLISHADQLGLYPEGVFRTGQKPTDHVFAYPGADGYILHTARDDRDRIALTLYSEGSFRGADAVKWRVSWSVVSESYE